MKTIPQISNAEAVARMLADRTPEPPEPNRPPPRPDTIRNAGPEVARRILAYAGASWNSQLTAVRAPCWFKVCIVANKGAAAFWLWVCDNTEAAATPTLCPLYVPPGTTQAIDRTQSPRLMQNGIYVCATTDPVTKTLITTNDAFFELAYETEL